MNLFASARDIDIEAFAALCAKQVNAADYPHSARIENRVVIYHAQTLRQASTDNRLALLAELHHSLSQGPGVLVVQGAYPDTTVVDRHSAVFEAILADEAKHGAAADHFAKAGANGRIWNSLQKAAERSPQSFIEYYANPLLGLIAESWLGPSFQATAQVNVVRPGGQAQQPHRDYHLGFQTEEVAARFPLPLHVLSQYLTLQGAVAHTDMPLESGPTLLLPFSQQYALGYLAWRDSRFIEYFSEHAVQLPLKKGDLLFFNPALFHAAGSNRTTDFHRMANLLQMSSAFGKPMESIDRDAMMLSVYPALVQSLERGEMDEVSVQSVVAMTADGYSFPTNLDTDPPLNGLAPQTGQQLMIEALQARWPLKRFSDAVTRLREKRRP
ncbi:phytanoyl-CoA dioxygenase family protein [Pseudomonas huanghezhanensis]|uniref:phytanoyl-CoA dioxygenase family protein n=1 Tax=Pseudomonas huanghezhanensis TaxID=3002903 RepID=UPI0022857DC3|nr:phytanoyl-CoA dioxygenase family protein [Pseudomonas sp. BSw22131]